MSYIMLTRKLIILFLVWIILSGCKKQDPEVYLDSEDRTISITDGITIDNGIGMKNPIFNYLTYEDFLRHITTSDHFLIVPLKDFKNTTSSDKVVLSIRHDMDDNIDASVKTAYRDHKYGITASFYVLHTAKYYGQEVGTVFKRNDKVIFYLKAIQDAFGQEVGFHNDLVTLQLIYEIPSREYLKNELAYLRGNGINIVGTTFHGSPYTYIYHYSNSDFWTEYSTTADEFITKGYKTIKVEKDSLPSYNFQYEGGMLNEDYFFSDTFFINGKRWNMSMVNLDTIKPGKKVIILTHPQHWNGDY
jgi:hypothetical protein